MLKFDLHTHSTASDGILSPKDLVSRAKSKGVDILALTDHDTVAGIDVAMQTAAAGGLHVIPGIELSSQWNGRGVHIVGLNIDHTHQAIKIAQGHQRAIREQRAVEISNSLQKIGLPGALVGARTVAGGGVIGRPHFARYLLQAGYVDSVNTAFKRYLGTGKVGDVKHLWPDMSVAIAWVKAAGGTAILAHPHKYKLTHTKLCALTEAFRAAGGGGIEVISGSQQSQVTEGLVGIANEFDLYASCGSDFHAPDQHWQELGVFGTLPAACKPVWELWS